MGKSYRKPIIKDRPRNTKKSTEYWRKVRRVTKQAVSKLESDEDFDVDIPNPKTIVNDYDYSDYKYISNEDDEFYEKSLRK